MASELNITPTLDTGIPQELPSATGSLDEDSFDYSLIYGFDQSELYATAPTRDSTAPSIAPTTPSITTPSIDTANTFTSLFTNVTPNHNTQYSFLADLFDTTIPSDPQGNQSFCVHTNMYIVLTHPFKSAKLNQGLLQLRENGKAMIQNSVDIEYLQIKKRDEDITPTKINAKPTTLADPPPKPQRKKQQKTILKEARNKENKHPNKKRKSHTTKCNCTKLSCGTAGCSCVSNSKGCSLLCGCRGCKNIYGKKP